jgi:HK97 family phage prohead protease
MQVKNTPISGVKAGPDDGLDEGEFLVYPSTFTRTPDVFGDVVAKGAFADTITEWKDSGNTMPGLYGHRLDDPDYFVAGATEMGEDDHGWWVKGAFDLDSPKGNQVYRLTKGRRLNQLSFAYDVLDEGKVELDGGETANELRKLKAYEFSFVPVGANQDTSVVAVKAITDALDHEVKAGRVLATRHLDKLKDAHTALGDVIADADHASDDDGKASAPQSAENEDSEAKVDEPEQHPAPMRLRTVELARLRKIMVGAT